jgi:DNA ligase-1
MEGLLDVYKIIKDIRDCGSTKAKQHILTKNADNELLKKILIYTYNDNQYGIQKKTLEKMTFEDNDELNKWGCNLFKMLDELASSNINKELTNEVEKFISYFTDEKVQELIMCILLKDLRFGMNVKSINKSIPNLIPQHQIMLASKFEGSLKGDVSMSLKLDGIRCSILIEEDIKYLSRQGVEIEGLNEITKALEEFNLEGYFIDGELIRKNINNLSSDDNFRLTTRIVNSKSNDKIGLEFVIFDIVPIEDYHKGKSKIQYKERLELMEELIGEGNEFIRLVPKFGVTNKVEDVYNKLDEVVANNQEGLMLNTLDGVYGFGKRPKDILKVKKMDTCDIMCLRVEEGEGKYEGKLGKIICDYKGYELGVGSGFTDEEREYFWNNPQNIINRIVEVQYFEESKNSKGELSLRFPVFKWVREDKNKESYN